MFGASQGEIRVYDVGVDGFDLVADIGPLCVEESDVLVGPALEDGAVDGDVGLREVLGAGRCVEICEGSRGLAAVQGVVVDVGEIRGRWGGFGVLVESRVRGRWGHGESVPSADALSSVSREGRDMIYTASLKSIAMWWM